MLRHLAVSYWTAAAFLTVIIAVHLWWLFQTIHTTHSSEVVSGFGAALVALGIFVASRPYLRNGLVSDINSRLPPFPYGFAGSEEGAQEHRDRVKKAMPGAVMDSYAERVVAVLVIGVGTILNGYGTPIARTMGWIGQ